jgi:hypothetical protein
LTHPHASSHTGQDPRRWDARAPSTPLQYFPSNNASLPSPILEEDVPWSERPLPAIPHFSGRL